MEGMGREWRGWGWGDGVRCGPAERCAAPIAGDEICINADFENTCSRIVVPKAAIVAKHTYLAGGQTKVFSQKLSCVRGNHIISGMSDSWRGKTIRVRKLKPSILGCNILRVEYFLQVGAGGGCMVGDAQWGWGLHGGDGQWVMQSGAARWGCMVGDAEWG